MSRMLHGLVLAALFALGSSAICEAQDLALQVVGLDGKAHEISGEKWAQFPRARIKVIDHGGAEVTFEGVPASALLKSLGVPLGSELRGQNLSLYVVAEGADGYKVVYALTEFDSGFTDAVVLIADHRDGQALSPNEGPLRMVVPWEKRQGRWLRQLVMMRVGRAQ